MHKLAGCTNTGTRADDGVKHRLPVQKGEKKTWCAYAHGGMGATQWSIRSCLYPIRTVSYTLPPRISRPTFFVPGMGVVGIGIGDGYKPRGTQGLVPTAFRGARLVKDEEKTKQIESDSRSPRDRTCVPYSSPATITPQGATSVEISRSTGLPESHHSDHAIQLLPWSADLPTNKKQIIWGRCEVPAQSPKESNLETTPNLAVGHLLC